MKRFSNGVLIFLAILSCAAFFLPWVKLKNAWNPSMKSLADSLQEQTETKLEWSDFIGLDEFEREAILNRTWQSLSGYELFMDLRQNSSTTEASRYFISQFLGGSIFPEKAYLLVLFSLLPGILSGLIIMVWKRPRTLVYAGVGLLLFYLSLRWKIAMTEGALLAVGMQVGIGFWLIIYSLLILALLLLGRAAFPQSKF